MLQNLQLHIKLDRTPKTTRIYRHVCPRRQWGYIGKANSRCHMLMMQFRLMIPPVGLSSLPNLRRIEWWCGQFSLLQISATQLCRIYESCKFGEIILGIYNLAPEDRESSKEHCRMINEILTNDIFPSLRRVQLSQNFPLGYFPTLQSRKLLSADDRWDWTVCTVIILFYSIQYVDNIQW